MSRKPLPEDKKKVPVKASLDPEVYQAIKDELSVSEWIAVACRMRLEAEKKKGKKI